MIDVHTLKENIYFLGFSTVVVERNLQEILLVKKLKVITTTDVKDAKFSIMLINWKLI